MFIGNFASFRGDTQEVCLWIETLVRPESLQLFGFKTPLERDWFRLLITVQGVGARMALSLLSVLNPSHLKEAILTKNQGVALRLLTELKKIEQKMPPRTAQKSWRSEIASP